jgi:hypothetical protein
MSAKVMLVSKFEESVLSAVNVILESNRKSSNFLGAYLSILDLRMLVTYNLGFTHPLVIKLDDIIFSLANEQWPEL